MAGRWVELSQPLFNGMPRAKAHGEAKFWVDKLPLPYDPCPTTICITHMEMATHVGTHIDAARHFWPAGRTIEQYPLDKFIHTGVILDLRREGPVAVTAEELKKAKPEIREGDIVFIYFGYADRFHDESYHTHPYLSDDAADWLVERKISVIGTDTVTPDLPGPCRPPDFNFPVHMRLLPKDILVVENLGMGLKKVLGKRVTIVVVPFRIEGADASPITALAIEEE